MPEVAQSPPPAKPENKPAPGPAGKTGLSDAPGVNLNALSAYEELDRISFDNDEKEKASRESAKKEPKSPDKAAPKPSKPEEDSPKEEPEKKPEKEFDLDHQDEAGKIAATPTKAKELREAYELTKKERDKLKEEVESLRKSTPKDDPERSALTERLTKEEKRRQELEEEIKYLNYERSDEYKQKYLDPLNKAYTRALKEIKEFTITEDNGNERPATADDFAIVMRLGPGEVVNRTKAWFGEAAAEVRAMRRQILELNEKSEEAVKEYREKGTQVEQSKVAEKAKQTEQAKALWDQHHKEALEKYPEYFAPKDGDEERNKALESGFAMTELFFNPPKDIPLEKRVNLASQIRHRVAGFGPLVIENKRLKEKLASLEKELEEFKESEPSKGDGNRVSSSAPKTWEQELDELAAKGGK